MKIVYLLLCCGAALMLCAPPAAAYISGSSTASNCGEGGNWIDITFTTDEGVTLVDAWWDWNATGVWLDPDGTSLCGPINEGVTSFAFYFDVPAGTNTQDFGLTATGFDGGDYFRFTMDLDMGADGSPFTSDYYGGTVTVEFSDGTILMAAFDTPYDEPNGATATFTDLGAMPDLAWTTKPGWAAPMVPRPADDATWTGVPAPTTLIGEADSTWISAACQNVGTSLAMASRLHAHLDGEFLGYRNLWTIGPGDWNGTYNFGPFNVPGGRHVIRVTADALDAVTESDETNNVYAAQWCWQGDPLPPMTNATRAAPPRFDQDDEYVTLSWHNCDGVRIVPHEDFDWCAVWGERLATGGNEYMLRLHPASDSPTDAFGTNYEATGVEVGQLQALLVNKHTFGGGPWDVGVIRFTDPAVEYRIGHTNESPYPFDFGIEPETPYFSSRLMMFQFHVDAADLGPATLVARTDPADGPVHLGWLAPDFTHGHLGDLNDLVTTDLEGVATINLDLTVTGDYCCVVYGNRSEHLSGLAVNVGLYGPRPDLETLTLSGWYAPVVPQPDQDAVLFDCGAPDTLYGGLPLTWMNFATRNIGTADADTVSWALSFDGIGDYGLRQFSTLGPNQTRVLQNLERSGTPWTVPGGRHTVSLTMDYLDELAESVECNNVSARQYCWSPELVPAGTVATRPAPPDRAGGHADCEPDQVLYPNCDGLRVEMPTTGTPFLAAAVMPPSMAANVDVELHAPLVGATEGFGPHRLAYSVLGDGLIDFVIVDGNEAPGYFYDVAVLDDPDGAITTYDLQVVLSTSAGKNPVGPGTPQTMPAGAMIALHHVVLAAGPQLITLNDLGATPVDWGLSIYGNRAFNGRTTHLADGIAYAEPAGGSEHILVDIPVTGEYGIAVWKVAQSELAKTGSYRLVFAPGVSGVDGTPPASAVTGFAAAAPNPFNPETVIAFDVVTAGPCRVTVHDLQGRLVRTLVDGPVTAGRHQRTWDGRDADGRRAASGVYVARLRAGDARDLIKLTLVK